MRCKYCGRIHINNWINENVDEDKLVKGYLEEKLGRSDFKYEISGDYFNRKVEFYYVDEIANKISGKFYLKTSYHSCPTCSKKRGNYFEAKIQLRGKVSKFEEILKFIETYTEAQTNPDIFITKIEKKKEGFDIFVSNKEFARNLSKMIVYKYGGSIIESRTLVGKRDGRDLFRFTYSVRIPIFSVLDLIKFKGKKWVVSRVHFNDLYLVDLEKWEERTFKIYDLEDSKILLRNGDYRQAEVLYSQDNSTYILNPFNYREVPVRRIDNVKSLLVAELDDEILIIPPWISRL